MKLTLNGLPVGSYQGILRGETRPTLAQVALRADSTICAGTRVIDVLEACFRQGVPVKDGRVPGGSLHAIGDALPAVVRERLRAIERLQATV